MPINPIKELSRLKPAVWKEIQKYLPIKEPEEHYKMVRDYPERQGKYLRPGLVLLSCKMYGGARQKAILTAACMQISEEWLLIHDDFEDHSLERRSTGERHKPSLNMLHGDELAVNAGDALHVIMWQALGDNTRKLGSRIGWQVYEKMTDILLATIEGQFLELAWIKKQKINMTEAEYFRMIDIKAGYYTIIGPLQLGAIVAGKNKAELKRIKEWGSPFGRAFQIWDDVMNLETASSKQGKEQAGDILEGKRTLILIHLLKNCLKLEKEKIIKIYQKERSQKTKAEIEYILGLARKYKSIEHAKNVAKNYAKTAKNIFDKNTKNLPKTKAQKIIRAAIDFVVNRER